MTYNTLRTAKLNKQDEFYTQLVDIENELKHYKDQLQGKTIFCNCDDPYESNFVKYFANNFNALNLKKLIATSYIKSPIVGAQLELPSIEGLKPEGKEPYKIEINEVPDLNKDGAINLDDVEYLLKRDKNVASTLKGDDKYSPGDFRSKECIELLKKADIIVTNPPFSLFREYIEQLTDFNKHFLILANQNAITYKEVFKHIKNNRLWLGYDNGGTKWFQVPDDYDITTESRKKVVNGVKYFSMGNIMWFTNLDTTKRHEKLPLYKKYSPDQYPKYENYDAIEVSRTTNIPTDYDKIMGVPITFLDKYNPEQFEIIGMSKTPIGSHLRTKIFSRQTQVNKNGTKSSVTKLNDGAAIKVKEPPPDKTYYIVNGKYYIAIYPRILIKRKGSK